MIGSLRGIVAAMKGMIEARRLLLLLRPSAVVGFGGYASLPTVLAAVRMGLPTLIHEQNAILGRANRFLMPWVRVLATSFTDTVGIRPSYKERTRQTGNPVRAGVVELAGLGYQTPQQDDNFSLLVFGGSQGAAVFGDIVPRALAKLPLSLRKRLRVVQQCLRNQIENVSRHYEVASIKSEIASFFDDMPSRIASAQLVIARAGASTVAELTCAGRPSILVPYPSATDDHQRVNAQAVERARGGYLIPQSTFTVENLATRLEKFIRLDSSLVEMAESAREMGCPDAAAQLAKIVESLMADGTVETRPVTFSEIAA